MGWVHTSSMLFKGCPGVHWMDGPNLLTCPLLTDIPLGSAFLKYHTQSCSEHSCACNWAYSQGILLWVEEYFSKFQKNLNLSSQPSSWHLGVFPPFSESEPKSSHTPTSCTILPLPVPLGFISPCAPATLISALPQGLCTCYVIRLQSFLPPPCPRRLAKLPLIFQSSSYRKHYLLQGVFPDCSDC